MRPCWSPPGSCCKPGYDWFFPYYRDRALCLALGNTRRRSTAAGRRRGRRPASGGRQMPSHWSSPALHIVSNPPRPRHSACTRRLRRGGAILRATSRGRRKAGRSGDYRAVQGRRVPRRRGRLRLHRRGLDQQGEFWEALNTASNRSCLSSSSLKTMATRSRCRSKSTLRAETSRGWSQISPTSTSPRSTEPTPSPAMRAMRRPSPIAAQAKARRLSTATSSGPTRIRFPTMTDSIAPKVSARPTTLRDPLPKMQMHLLREGILDAEAITRLEKAGRRRSPARLPSGRCARRIAEA